MDPVPQATRQKASPSLTTRSICWVSKQLWVLSKLQPCQEEELEPFPGLKVPFFWAARVERCADVDFGLWWPADLRNHLLAKVVFPTAPKRSITCYKDMHIDRVDSRGRSIGSIMIYLCLFCEYSSSSCPCFFSWEESKRMSVHDIECTFSVAQQYLKLSLANLISSLSIFVYFTCRKQTLQWMQGEMLHSWHDYITDHEAPFVSPIISLHFWHHFVGLNCQGDQEDELSMEDLHETTARIHALLDAEAALATWMQDNAFGWTSHNERLYVLIMFFSGWHDAPPFLRCTM